MKFAKHLAKAMNVSDPEWNPFWVNYKHLKRLLKPSTARANTNNTASSGDYTVVGNNSEDKKRKLRQQEAAARAAVGLLTRQRSGDSLVDQAHAPRLPVKQAEVLQPVALEPAAATEGIQTATDSRAVLDTSPSPQEERKPKFEEEEETACRGTNWASSVRNNSRKSNAPASAAAITTTTSHSGRGRTAVLLCCPSCTSSCAKAAAAAGAVPEGGVEVPAADDRRYYPSSKCPFFDALLREIDMCRAFFLQNEAELKVRVKRLRLALNQLKNPDLSRLSSVQDKHVKLMQACVNFYRDALLLEDFAMVNYTAVIKLLKKRDKLAGTSDQRLFMTEVMAGQPFAMYPGVARRVVQVEEIFGEIENMCFLRTGAGMKSVMKTELAVVEAILQLAQESENAQHKVLHDGKEPSSPPPGLVRRNSLLAPVARAASCSGHDGGDGDKDSNAKRDTSFAPAGARREGGGGWEVEVRQGESLRSATGAVEGWKAVAPVGDSARGGGRVRGAARWVLATARAAAPRVPPAVRAGSAGFGWSPRDSSFSSSGMVPDCDGGGGGRSSPCDRVGGCRDGGDADARRVDDGLGSEAPAGLRAGSGLGGGGGGEGGGSSSLSRRSVMASARPSINARGSGCCAEGGRAVTAALGPRLATSARLAGGGGVTKQARLD